MKKINKNKVIDVLLLIAIVWISWEITDYFTENIWKTDRFLPELVTYLVVYLALSFGKDFVRSRKSENSEYLNK